MARAVVPCFAASVLLHALPLAVSPGAASIGVLPVTPAEIELALVAPESRTETAATLPVTEAQTAPDVGAAAVVTVPREPSARAPERALAPGRVASSTLVAPADSDSPTTAPDDAQTAIAGAAIAGAAIAAAPAATRSGVPDGLPAVRAPLTGAAAETLAAARSRYLQALRERVLERREYPHRAQRAGLEGTVCLRLSVDGAGRISELRASCGPVPPLLLEAALSAVRAAQPFGPLPAGIGQLSVDLPVVFQLNAR